MVGRELASRFFEDRTRPRTTVRPSVQIRDLDRVLRHVVRMRRRQVPHRQASTPRPPHVMFLTRPSPRLAIFIACYVARAGKAWERGYVYTMITVHFSLHRSNSGSTALCHGYSLSFTACFHIVFFRLSCIRH